MIAKKIKLCSERSEVRKRKYDQKERYSKEKYNMNDVSSSTLVDQEQAKNKILAQLLTLEAS
jgi:DNA-binding TFAR19-related protein (PDSD5 family)